MVQYNLDGGSSNGRTIAFGAIYLGSNPSPPTRLSPRLQTTHMYYVYILKSKKTGKLYFGYTKDLKRRIKEHEEGKSKYTKGHLPIELVCYIAFKSVQKAKAFEKYIKSGSGKAFTYKRFVVLAKDE